MQPYFLCEYSGNEDPQFGRILYLYHPPLVLRPYLHRICENVHCSHICKSLEIPFWNIQFVISRVCFMLLARNSPQEVAKSLDSITRQLCGELQPGGFSLTATRANWRHYGHSWTSDMPQKAAAAKADWWTVGTHTHMHC